MNRTNVPGGWIDFRDPNEVKERHRRAVFKMGAKAARFTKYLNADGEMDTTNLTPEEADEVTNFLTDYNDALAIALINEWSFDAPISTDGLLDLPGEIYDLIIKHCSPLGAAIMPSFSVDGADDPKAPTAS